MSTGSSALGSGPRRLLIVSGSGSQITGGLFDDVAERLRAKGVVVGVHQDEPIPPARDHPEWDVVVTDLDRNEVSGLGSVVYGGRAVPRPESLRWLEDAGVPTMDWALPANRLEVMRLFRRWRVDRLLLKPSGTYGGSDVCVFTRRSVPRMKWDPAVDVVCREVDPADGSVYKIELLGGSALIGWKSAAPPISEQLPAGRGRGLRGAYGERSLWEPDPGLEQRLLAFSAALTSKGFGHVSVDLMRAPDGTFVAIELNPKRVAMWWTHQFESFRDRYADAMYDIVMGADLP